MDYPPVSKERASGVFNREIDMPTTPHNRLTRWPIPVDDSRDYLRKFQDILDRQPPQYYGGPTQLMSALSAEMEAEKKLAPIEPRHYCRNCEATRRKCMIVCGVMLLGVAVMAAVAMWS